jgi:hypothetical protein
MWRLSAEDGDYRWSYYTYLAPGPTAEDAMRHVVASIKAGNAKYSFIEPDPIPQVMWAVPIILPTTASHLGDDLSDTGEDFEGMFDYMAEVEVRL